MSQPPSSQFHNGEIAIQTRVGVADMIAKYSEGFIRSAMPDQHREFFSSLSMVVIGITDDEGYPWAMPLFGHPGFIQSPDAKTLKIAVVPILVKVLKLDFKANKKIGFLGIEPRTCRRNRMNGIIKAIAQNSFSIVVEQSFGNCPQYIQRRELSWVNSSAENVESKALSLDSLPTSTTIDLIQSADTFFISSRTHGFSNDNRDGLDVSHRGGKPGFVKVEGDTLYFPDFSGNRFYNTLGNIQSDERVGLYFPNYTNGNAVFISGCAEIIWDAHRSAEFDGAECIVSIKIHSSLFIDNFLPMRGELKELSPSLTHTGTWQQKKPDATLEAKSAYTTCKITRKVKESHDITSFYFSPLNGSPVSTYLPGQFVPISINRGGSEVPILRSYTLSRAQENDAYRISVKRKAKGLASQMLHDDLHVGDCIDVGQPTGQFTVVPSDHAIVLLSSGVGITPMIAMLQGLARDTKQGAKPRNVWCIYGTQNSETHAFAETLNILAQQHTWLQLHIVYSQPKPSDLLGGNCDTVGRISIDLLKNILPFDHFSFYLCGSESFMRSLYAGLMETGVAKANISYEFFGEGSIEDNTVITPSLTAEHVEVHFAKSHITATWTPKEGTLLEFAEKQGLQPMNSCRIGNCGACSCKINTGNVMYEKTTGYTPDHDSVLVCSARPAADSDTITLNL